jgi:ABC-type lipoprotein export system ATPase subunit
MGPTSPAAPPPSFTVGGSPAVHLQGLCIGGPHGGLLVGPLDLRRPKGWHGALIGPSGSGKSTLLLCIAGVHPPAQGQIEVCGEKPWAMSETKRVAWRAHQLGLVLQRVHLLPHLTVTDNLNLAGHLAGLPSKEIRQRANTHLEQFGLMGLSHRAAGSLSIGEQQRIAVVRALIHEPALVLADEPTAALDPASASQVESALREGCTRIRATLLMVTHDPDLAARTSEVLRMAEGRLLPSEEAA